jgi:hypothetical protein
VISLTPASHKEILAVNLAANHRELMVGKNTTNGHAAKVVRITKNQIQTERRISRIIFRLFFILNKSAPIANRSSWIFNRH